MGSFLPISTLNNPESELNHVKNHNISSNRIEIFRPERSLISSNFQYFLKKGFAPILLSGSFHGLGSAVLSVHRQTRVLLAAPLRA